MNCRKFEKNIYSYFKKELSRQEQDKIALHLRKCSACREKFALFSGFLKETEEELRKRKPALPPPPFTKYYEEKRILRRNLIPALTALAAVFVLFAVFSVFQNGHKSVKETKQFSSVSRIMESRPSEKLKIMTVVKRSKTISGKKCKKSRSEVANVLSIKEPVPKSASLVLLTENPNVRIIWDLNYYE